MSPAEVEEYLSRRHIFLDQEVGSEIESMRLAAIAECDEIKANHYWCLGRIFVIQQKYLSAFMSLKSGAYEEAWYLFDEIDIAMAALEGNFIIDERDRHSMLFIGRIVKEYQKLFPYRYFLSRESVIKAEKCSICGKKLSLRDPCGHTPGKLYMGELCSSIVTEFEIKAFCIVEDPFDRYSFLKIKDAEYSYETLEKFMKEIHSPYDDFRVEIRQVKKSEYEGVSRNAFCPCGSGKKYKKCHMGRDDERTGHYVIHMLKKGNFHSAWTLRS